MADPLIEVTGANHLFALSKTLRLLGDKELQREMSQGLNRAMKPVRASIQDSARHTLPRRGGLAARAAKSPIRVRRRAGAQIAGISLVAVDKSLSMWHLNQGQVRHPIKGKPPARWTVQHTRPGFWDRPTEAAAEDVRRELMRVMSDTAAKIGRSTR